MGREVRRVPADWQHPKERLDGRICFKPLENGYLADRARYDLHKAKWDEGLIPDYSDYENKWLPKDEDAKQEPFEEFYGGNPDPDEYMPVWTPEQATHFQMYETCTEGTPISPVMESIEDLARWLTDNKASAFAGMTATYEEWLAMCQQGHCFSGAVIHGEIISGVAAVSK